MKIHGSQVPLHTAATWVRAMRIPYRQPWRKQGIRLSQEWEHYLHQLLYYFKSLHHFSQYFRGVLPLLQIIISFHEKMDYLEYTLRDVEGNLIVAGGFNAKVVK